MTALPPPPAELARFAEYIPPGDVLRLVERFGGTRIYVPRAPNQASPLVQAIGRDAALALSAALGGEECEVPLAKYWRILVYAAQGHTQATIARLVGTNERTVRQHLANARARAGQPDLFGA